MGFFVLLCLPENAFLKFSVFSICQSIACISQISPKNWLECRTIFRFDLHSDIDTFFYDGFFRKRNMIFGFQYNFFYVWLPALPFTGSDFYDCQSAVIFPLIDCCNPPRLVYVQPVRQHAVRRFIDLLDVRSLFRLLPRRFFRRGFPFIRHASLTSCDCAALRAFSWASWRRAACPSLRGAFCPNSHAFCAPAPDGASRCGSSPPSSCPK